MFSLKFSAVLVASAAYNKKKTGLETMQQNSTFQTESPSLREVQSTSTRSNADVLAKALLDIKLLLDIEKVLAEELDFEMPLKRRPVHDQILKIIDEAGAVSAAEGIQAGFRGLSAVK